jgi:hypothetical protein
MLVRYGSYTHHITDSGGVAGAGGRGEFGLYVGEDFLAGCSGSSETFYNAPLAKDRNFEVAQFECWALQHVSNPASAYRD